MEFLLGDSSGPHELLINDKQNASTHTPYRGFNRHRLPSSFSIVSAVLLAVASPKPTPAQNPADTAGSCDPTLMKVAQGGEYGYSRHDDRCEGIHRKEVAGRGILRMIALARADDANLDSLPSVHISWGDVGDSSIALLARSTRPHIFYAMTTVQPGRSGTYEWTSKWSRAEGLKPGQFGYLAWLGNLRVPETKRVYVPLQVSGSSQRDPTASYYAVFIPGEPLREVLVSIGELGAPGAATHWLYERKPIGRMLYSRDRPITIAIPHSQARFLRVQLSTQTTSGVPVAFDFVTLSP